MNKKVLILAFAVFALAFSAGARTRLFDMCCDNASRVWIATAVAGADNIVNLSYSDNSGKSWSEGVTGLDVPGTVETATFWPCPDGSLKLFVSSAGGSDLYCFDCTSPSGKAPAWTKAARIGGGYVTSPPVVLKNGVVALPFARLGCAGVMLSKDGGRSWNELPDVVTVPSLAPTRSDATIIDKGEDGIRLVMRGSDNKTSCWAWVSTTYDNFQSWTKPRKFIDNPDRPICIRQIPGGRLLMVKNCYFDKMAYILPDKLVCYVSDDGGDTWWGELRLTSDYKGVNPHACQDASGNILIAYDYDTEGACEIRLATTTLEQIASVWGDRSHENLPAKSIFKDSKASAAAAAEFKALFPQKKNWASATLMVGTYNIQHCGDEKSYQNVWRPKRMPALAKIFEAHPFDVVGCQEPTRRQINDMLEMEITGQRFGDVYDFVGKPVSAKEGDMNCHYDPIFFRKDRVECLEWDIEWFTPVPGKAGFGAYSSRHCCWAHFRDKKTGKEFFCINSHTDHLGEEARVWSSFIIINLAKRICKGLPCFFTGDFNTVEGSEPYNILMESGFIDDALISVYNPVNAEYYSMSHYKPMSTVPKSGKHIDHVFYTYKSSKMLSWELVTDSYNDYFGSDHLPIICEWKIAN